MNNHISIIIVNYNGYNDTIECIQSLEKQKYDNFDIIIIDNASTDNSIKFIEYELLNNLSVEVKLIKLPVNLGFSGGNNVGIKYAIEHCADYILLLNNDTIVDQYMLSELMQKANCNTVIVPKMLYYYAPQKIWYAGGYLDLKKCSSWHIGIDCADNNKYNKECIVDFATGCCMLLSRSIIEEVGYWDESYFLYFEDVDYSLRLKEMNIPIMYLPTACLWHKVYGSSSTKGKSAIAVYYNTRNRLFTLKKYNYKSSIRVKVIITYFIKYILSFIRHKENRYLIYAILDYAKAKKGKKNFAEIPIK